MERKKSKHMHSHKSWCVHLNAVYFLIFFPLLSPQFEERESPLYHPPSTIHHAPYTTPFAEERETHWTVTFLNRKTQIRRIKEERDDRREVRLNFVEQLFEWKILNNLTIASSVLHFVTHCSLYRERAREWRKCEKDAWRVTHVYLSLS